MAVERGAHTQLSPDRDHDLLDNLLVDLGSSPPDTVEVLE
jgi:hypothetical protein